MLVTVSAFREPYEAHLFAGRLRAEGIVAFVSYEMHIANKWILSYALGGVKVQVSSDEIELAREVERACRRGEYQALLRDEFGDIDDPVCPRCGGSSFRKRRPLPRAALALLVSLAAGTIVPPIGWILRCEGCLREFRAPHRPFPTEKILLASVTAGLFMVLWVALVHWYHKVFGCTFQFPCL